MTKPTINPELAEAEAYAAEGWTWLGVALRALGVEHVFQIPDWRKHLGDELAAERGDRDATDLAYPRTGRES